MNDNYYKNPIFPSKYEENDSNKNIYYQTPTTFNEYEINDKNINDILKLNKGKLVKIYTTFKNENEEKKLKGIIETEGNNYIIISDPSNGSWYIIKSDYIKYIEFEEAIKFN